MNQPVEHGLARERARRKDALRDWLAEANGSICPADIRDDTPLIGQRIITSLQVMDLIGFLEELFNQDISVEQLAPGVFKSIDSIMETFGEEELGDG